MTIDAKRVKEIFLEAAELSDEAARAAYLDKACAGDAGVRERVEALLRAHDPDGSFLGTPAAVVPALGDGATQAFSGSPAQDHAATRTSDGGSGNSDEEPLTFLSPPTRPDSLGRIGHYEVLQVLGRGGFGIVFRAFDETLQRVVALKVMAPQLAATSPARKRFLREARSSAQVRHENVVQVYEVAEQPLPYLAMEFIPGETLQQKLDRVGPLDVQETLRIGRQIAEGLAAAHATDLIHRDIKPGNVLLEGGQHKVKITDFGLARAADDASISQSGIIAGTPMYMAPEQALGQTLDQRVDLFSLGSVLYQMVAGRPPFRANSTLAVLKRVAEDTPRPIREIIPETPQWLCDIIAKLHAKNPDDRYQSAREVADVLADCEAQLKANARLKDYSRIPRSQPQRSGRRKWVAAAAAVLLPVIALAVLELAGVTHLFRGQPGTSDTNKSARPSAPLAAPDFREIHGADGQTLQAWMEGLQADGLRPAILTVQPGVEPARFTALAVRDESRTPWLFQHSLSFRAFDERRPGLLAQGYRHAGDAWHAQNGQRLKSSVFVKDGRRWGGWSGDRAFIDKKLQEARATGYRPVFLEAIDGVVPNGLFYGMLTEPDEAVAWQTELDLTATALRHLVEKQRQRGWRLEHLNTAWMASGGPRFLAIFAANAGGEDWSFRDDMTSEEYEKELAEQRGRGFRPSTVAVFGAKDDPRYTAVWTPSRAAVSTAKDKPSPKPAPSPDDSDSEGWVQLFNGKDLTGWKTHPDQPGDWKVEGGVLVGSGSPRSLFTERGDYTSFRLRAQVQINSHGLFGIGFRTGYGLEGSPDWGSKTPVGYEAEINPDRNDLVGRQPRKITRLPSSRKLVKPGEWFTLEIIAEGNHLVLKVDGATAVDVFIHLIGSPAVVTPPAGTKVVYYDHVFTKGHIALLTHLATLTGQSTTVQFRKIEIKELPHHVRTESGAKDKPSSPAIAPFTDADVQRIAALPAAQQVEEVRKELKKRNPGFDGKMETKIEGGVVTEFRIVTNKVTDIAPIRVFNALRVLDLWGTKVGDAGLAHFKDCKNLRWLKLRGTQVTDSGLTHFKDYKNLIELDVSATQVGDTGMAHLKDCQNLTGLVLVETHVTDAGLSLLKGHTSLSRLYLGDNPQVSDTGLAHLKDMLLKRLDIYNTGITDLSPLQGMPLQDIRLTPKNIVKGMDILRGMKSLKTIGIDWNQIWPAAEFWERYDKGAFKK
jgi:serine/threonine protein kinase